MTELDLRRARSNEGESNLSSPASQTGCPSSMPESSNDSALQSIDRFLDQEITADGQDQNQKLLQLLREATRAKNRDAVAHLLPKLSTVELPEELVHQAVDSGLEIYKLYFAHNPKILKFQWQGAGDAACLTIASGDTEFLEYLLSVGADPGWSLLSPRIAVRYLPIEYISFSTWISESVLQFLLRHGALVKGTYALQLAAQTGRVEIVRALLKAGADVEGLPECIEGELETPDGPFRVEKIEIHESNGTALHSAVSGGCLAIVEMLVEKGADLKALDNEGRTPLMKAHEEDKEDIVAILTI